MMLPTLALPVNPAELAALTALERSWLCDELDLDACQRRAVEEAVASVLEGTYGAAAR